MGVLDFFKRTGKPITAETVEAKARDVADEISKKESTIAKLRGELPGQVLDGDNLAAHRIEHEEREIRALQVTKTELEAKALELRHTEAANEEASRWDAAAAKGRECSTLAKALISAIEPGGAAARALLAANAKFVAAIPFNRDYLGTAGPVMKADLGRLLVLALEDPDSLESAIASTVDLCVVNAESRRSRRDKNEEAAAKQANGISASA